MSHDRQFHPYNFLRVYLPRPDRGKWKRRVGDVFRLVDDIADERDWENAAKRYKDDNDEVDAALLPLRGWLLSDVFGNVYCGMQSLLTSFHSRSKISKKFRCKIMEFFLTIIRKFI